MDKEEILEIIDWLVEELEWTMTSDHLSAIDDIIHYIKENTI